ncbi:MAG: phage virion morphogenesis protein [Porphyromonadaceae bacterium]|nr:phage virion morphogenesis protein [Porphyromonadaceae bacterium]
MATMTPEQFAKMIEQHATEIQMLIDRTLPIKAGAIAKKHFRENFEKGGFVDDGLHEWKPAKRLSSKYGDKKNKTLMSSRKHLYSNTLDIPHRGGVKIENRTPYAAAHNEGTTTAGKNRNVTIQRRQFIGDSAELTEKIKEVIQKEIDKIVK